MQYILSIVHQKELNVIDNTIEDATNGIIDIGSWSYISRNTIIGDEGSGYGITLDDYNDKYFV